MINFRYHIVSITAVFLALGIGVALGSTFLDRATVDLLDRNISNAEAKITRTEAENQRLRAQLDAARARDRALTQDGSPQLFPDQVDGVPLLMVVAPDADSATLDTVSKVLASTGADYRGALTLSNKLAFDGDPDTGLAGDLGLDAPTSARLKREVNRQLRDALVAAGRPAEPADGGSGATTSTTTTAVGPTVAPGGGAPTTTASPTTTSTLPADSSAGEPPAPDGTQPAILTTLLDRGYVGYEPAPGADADQPLLETTGYRYVFLTTEGLEAEDQDVLLALLPASSADALPAVIASTTPPPVVDGADPVEPSAVARIRASDLLASRYSTVDDIDTFAGQAATVVVLDRMDELKVGHYGQGPGATAVFPPP